MRSFRSQAFDNTALATEAEVANGKVTREIEHMFYARVTGPEALLKAASVEIQEQWGLWQDKTDKNAGSGSNRVRKTIHRNIVNGRIDDQNDQVQYVLTTKLKKPNGESLEIPLPSSPDGLVAYRILAESGMIKHRYRFPVPELGLTWEVDMFVIPGESMYSTKYHPWAKIDLEVPNYDTPVPELPEGFIDMFDSKKPDHTPEQQAIMEEMKQFMSLPNPYVKEFYKDVTGPAQSA